jgi:hypothetical protein
MRARRMTKEWKFTLLCMTTLPAMFVSPKDFAPRGGSAKATIGTRVTPLDSLAGTELATSPTVPASFNSFSAVISPGPLTKGAPPVGASRVMTVYGTPDDHYLGKRTADGTKYTRESVWFASNDFKLGTLVTVTCGKRTLTAPVKDRMSRKYTGKRIDATIKSWKLLTDRPYGKVKVAVRRAK